MIDYFFSSQNIEITEFHEKTYCVNSIIYIDTRASKSAVIRHQIIQFNFEEVYNSDCILKASVKYMYEFDGYKSGLVFKSDDIKNKMNLGKKCISVLDKEEINHYYPSMHFTIEMNTDKNTVVITDCYQRIIIIRKDGTTVYPLEYIVNEIVCNQLQSWNINTDDIALPDLIDLFLMVKI